METAAHVRLKEKQEKTMTFWESLLSNQILMSAVAAWALAQVLKTAIDMALNRNFNPERLVGSGGMPSSHSATVCGMTAAAAMHYGVDSFELAVCFVFSLVVMYDAMGVRRETGKQAKLLNNILLENPLKLNGEFIQEKLKEYVGHTPLQVAAGALLGIGLAFFMGQYY